MDVDFPWREIDIFLLSNSLYCLVKAYFHLFLLYMQFFSNLRGYLYLCRNLFHHLSKDVSFEQFCMIQSKLPFSL